MEKFIEKKFTKKKEEKSFFLVGSKVKKPEQTRWHFSTTQYLDLDKSIYSKFNLVKGKEVKPIFKGLKFYFNGRGEDEISNYHLSKISALHSAQIERFLTSNVTHIITKIVIKEMKPRFKYVTPEWVIESIKNQKLLEIDQFVPEILN